LPDNRHLISDGERYRDVGEWCETKNSIIDDYCAPYTKIIRSQPWFRDVWYVDAFAGDPINLSRAYFPIVEELVEGSAARALKVDPPFSHHHFIDMDPESVRRLQGLAGDRQDITVHQGDANKVLLNSIVPYIQWASYRRALVILDPYGMNLKWTTIQALGDTRTADVFINFPMMGINRNSLWRDDSKVSQTSLTTMDDLWGSPEWRSEFYGVAQLHLFGNPIGIKTATNASVVDAFCKRMRTEASFQYVANPLPIYNGADRLIYYLIFASKNENGYRIVSEVMNKRRRDQTGAMNGKLFVD
jgi:three-Cys-motif partner protein